MEEAKFGVVSTVLANEKDAQDLANDIIESRLAACVQHMPVQSTYHWQGKMETASEHLLNAKTLIARAVELMAFIRTRHSYDAPEIILVPIIGGSQVYLDWMERETSG